MTSTADVSVIPDRNLQNLYLEAVQTIDDVRHYVYYCLDMSTDLSTGETQTNVLFRLKKSQPQIMHDGKIYCLGGNGQIGYVDPTGGAESDQQLNEALETGVETTYRADDSTVGE
ncbi:MAG: hypothetical protein PUA87_08510 [Oscillospiraceae bacterium]|nr:hypothetical protein [Oscillospiraceae bacterium]